MPLAKAFDLVNHGILFKRLLERNLPLPIVCLLLIWYKDQCMQVRWQRLLSHRFSVSNGVRQGGILSPVLFTVYLDDLLVGLEHVGVGCLSLMVLHLMLRRHSLSVLVAQNLLMCLLFVVFPFHYLMRLLTWVMFSGLILMTAMILSGRLTKWFAKPTVCFARLQVVTPL